MGKSKIYKKLEALGEDIMKENGKCIIICHDGESKQAALAALLHNPDEATSLFISFFQRFPEFIPKALMAASVAMECTGDCDNCAHACHKKDDDKDDDESIVRICMN